MWRCRLRVDRRGGDGGGWLRWLDGAEQSGIHAGACEKEPAAIARGFDSGIARMTLWRHAAHAASFIDVGHKRRSDSLLKMVCPFCTIDAPEAVWSSLLLVAFRDRYPVNPGHTLIVPRRHIATWFDASEDERRELWRALDEVRASLDSERPAQGYNVGFNAGVAAGQTVFHAHVHLIPRFSGDVEDPRGGVRHVIPQRARYWEPRS